MFASDHSLVQIVIAGLVASAIAGRLAWRSRTLTTRFLLTSLTMCFLVPSGILVAGMNPWLIDARLRTYRLFYWDIRNGMNRQEILAVMDRHYPAGESRTRPIFRQESITKLTFQLAAEGSAEPAKEEISLQMEEGRVIRKDYTRTVE